MNIYALGSNLLEKWNDPMKPFAAWLHFNRKWNDHDAKSIARLVSTGCRYFLVTGEQFEYIHEMIDYIAMDETSELVLTSAKLRINEDSAFEFISTRCPGDACKLRMLAAFETKLDDEVPTLIEMVRAIEETLIDSNTNQGAVNDSNNL